MADQTATRSPTTPSPAPRLPPATTTARWDSASAFVWISIIWWCFGGVVAVATVKKATKSVLERRR